MKGKKKGNRPERKIIEAISEIEIEVPLVDLIAIAAKVIGHEN